MVKTFKELTEIDEIIAQLYQENENLKKTKFGYGYSRFAEKGYYPHLKIFKEELQDIRIEHALEDEKTKEILRDQASIRGYKYSKDGERKVIKAEKELVEKWDKKEFEVEPYIVTTDLPEMTEEQKEKLSGVLITVYTQE